ncbi:MAG: metal ABC transporter ATP-binding protein [Cenarchaeum sp. SB0665_bin_23]|nr:metal ABC transporter ATP-binding protein [Cenarchaeum sp. SB0667_bin_13]MXY61383.1 metal ABC transporter ATP-binding protein [Cenarchaeum sp. SB0665_bin_23]MYB46840.1 metal ABC transporter ATP-binding protein [Cenarchaeum sp. SB0662_bin_33]MYG33251.1 metal ABC transporter ATP-binding protein [Cenarchaeum sp. SB0677_bin_16]
MQLDTVLSVRDLWINYGEKIAVEDISYDVQKGDLVGVVGPNGAGKSSMFKAILGLLPYRGTVKLFGHKFHRELLRSVGYVPQKILFEPMFPATVFDVVSMVLSRANSTHHDRKNGIVNSHMSDYEKVESCLKATRIWHLHNRRIGTLSGGELQRVLISQSLANNPLLLIMDEPVVGLDTRSRKLFFSIIQKASEDHNITIVISLHHLDAVKEYSNKVICMNRSLTFYGKTSDFFANETLMGLCADNGILAHPHEHSH